MLGYGKCVTWIYLCCRRRPEGAGLSERRRWCRSMWYRLTMSQLSNLENPQAFHLFPTPTTARATPSLVDTTAINASSFLMSSFDVSTLVLITLMTGAICPPSCCWNHGLLRLIWSTMKSSKRSIGQDLIGGLVYYASTLKNTKSETNTKFKCPNDQNNGSMRYHWNHHFVWVIVILVIRACFEFRYSDLILWMD